MLFLHSTVCVELKNGTTVPKSIESYGPVARTSLEINWDLRSFRFTHYVILRIILNVFYELNGVKLTFFLISYSNQVLFVT